MDTPIYDNKDNINIHSKFKIDNNTNNEIHIDNDKKKLNQDKNYSKSDYDDKIKMLEKMYSEFNNF